MLDKDLAELYNVETKALKQAVKRNLDRFPEHFMFELTKEEFEALRSQTVTSKTEGRGGTPHNPSENHTDRFHLRNSQTISNL